MPDTRNDEPDPWGRVKACPSCGVSTRATFDHAGWMVVQPCPFCRAEFCSACQHSVEDRRQARDILPKAFCSLECADAWMVRFALRIDHLQKMKFPVN